MCLNTGDELSNELCKQYNLEPARKDNSLNLWHYKRFAHESSKIPRIFVTLIDIACSDSGKHLSANRMDRCGDPRSWMDRSSLCILHHRQGERFCLINRVILFEIVCHNVFLFSSFPAMESHFYENTNSTLRPISTPTVINTVFTGWVSRANRAFGAHAILEQLLYICIILESLLEKEQRQNWQQRLLWCWPE